MMTSENKIASNLNVLTLNVRGLNNDIKRKKLFTWLTDNNIHITFIQETFCTKKAKGIYIAKTQ